MRELNFSEISRNYEKTIESVKRVSDCMKQFKFEEAVKDLEKIKEQFRNVEDLLKEKEGNEVKLINLEQELKKVNEKCEELERENIQLKNQQS